MHKDATHPKTPKQTTKFEINYGLQERVGEVKRFMETISEIEIPVFLHAQKYERIKNRIASIIHIIKEKTEHICIYTCFTRSVHMRPRLVVDPVEAGFNGEAGQ